MILHTIISEYDIFNSEENEQPTQFVNIAGGMLEYRVFNGEKLISRLHSTNPYLYLRDEYSPYTILH